MAASVLKRSGLGLVRNRARSNMAGGVASALVTAARRTGGIYSQFGLFEVDELWLDRLVKDFAPEPFWR